MSDRITWTFGGVSGFTVHCNQLNHLKITRLALLLKDLTVLSIVLKRPITRYNEICNKLRTKEIQWISYE